MTDIGQLVHGLRQPDCWADADRMTDAADEIERLRTAGQGLYDVLDQMWKCGLRRDNVALAMDIWDGIPVAATPQEDTP